ncbi:hypothetical protein GGR52DRAFT_55163 [Hypoxylon sp. FL1284]|nr:hypothetical protein GGR52DRAFT_55163 [Hypoxylon sp. FL1284]
MDDGATAGPDYSWIIEQYPVPSHQDLIDQVNAFLVSPPPLIPPRETLWVFDIGFWDIWNLAALPRKLATRTIEAKAQQFFAVIEFLYTETHRNGSVLFSDVYASGSSTTTRNTTETLLRPPFRVLVPKPFDVSLTPGFENARLEPPPPHNRAEQMRNAAFLTSYWDKAVQDAVNEWERLPEPPIQNEDEKILSDIKDADLLLRKRGGSVGGIAVPPARREAITYDTTSYVEELMVERQLRNADVVDHNGFGSKGTADRYSEIWEPCIRQYSVFDDGNNSTGNGTEDNTRWSVCETPDQHLFWTDFTANREVIFEIGTRVAEVYMRHIQTDSEWAAKSGQPPSSLRKGSDGEPIRAEGTETY